MKYCPSCGAGAEQAAAFCMACGKAFPKRNTQNPLDYHKNGKGIKIRRGRPPKPPTPSPDDPFVDLSEQEQVESHTQAESPYDGYYDDVQPMDDESIPTQIDRSMVKQIALLIGGALAIIIVVILIMPFL